MASIQPSRGGWIDEREVYGVFARNGNERHTSSAPILTFEGEKEAQQWLNGQVDNPLVHDSQSNVVEGYVRRGRTIKGSDKVERGAIIYRREK